MVGLLRFAVVRTLALQGLFGRPWRIPGDVAIADAHNLAGSAFDEVFEGESAERFTGGRTIPVPVTVAWCTRDPLFDPKTCAVDELPASTVLEVLPGCGHVPTWDDPDRVLGVIRATTARATGPRPRAGAGVGAGSDLPVPAGDPSPPPTTAPA
jgi:pimeloyl-ACP methyl ester carboxylesterase